MHNTCVGQEVSRIDTLFTGSLVTVAAHEKCKNDIVSAVHTGSHGTVTAVERCEHDIVSAVHTDSYLYVKARVSSRDPTTQKRRTQTAQEQSKRS